MRPSAVVVVVLVAACARSRPESQVPTPPVRDHDSEGCIPDPDDRCKAFGDGCPRPNDDRDGCPDGHVELTSACRLDGATRSEVDRIAKDVREERRLSTLRLVARRAACGEAVRAELVSAGVEPARLVVVVREVASPTTSGGVWFEVAAWDGAPCEARLPQ